MWNKATDAEESFRNKAIWWSAAAVVVVIVGIAAYYRYHASSGQPEKVWRTISAARGHSCAAHADCKGALLLV